MLPIEVQQAANAKAVEHNLPPAHVAAVVDVESDGQVFATVNGQKRPLILFEPHVLYRLTAEPVRGRLVAAGLAYKTQGMKPYPKTQAERWAQVADAQAIAGAVAYEAVSYGVGQVMGYHWQDLGFASLQDFISMMFSGAAGQIDIMLRFIVKNGLDDELRDGRWAAFARGYNGKNYAKGKYDVKLAEAARLYGGAVAEPDGMLRMGSKGARVRELQALLVRAGYAIKVDGDFGPGTKDALKAFQAAHNLTVDGVYGPETEHALAALRQSPEDKPGDQKPYEVKEVLQGLGTAVGGPVLIDKAQSAIDSATGQLQQYDGLSPLVGYGLTALSVLAVVVAVGGIGYAVYGWLKSRKTVEA